MSDQFQPTVVVGLIVLLGLMGTFFFVAEELETDRPDAARVVDHRTFGSEQVPARLWQDPFDAVLRYQAQAGSRQREQKIDAFVDAVSGEALAGVLARTAKTDVPSLAAAPSERGAAGADPTVEDDRMGGDRQGFVKVREEIIAHARKLRRPGIGDPPRITVLGVSVFSGPYVTDREFRLRTRYAILSAFKHLDLIPEQDQFIGFFTTPEQDVIPYEWFVSDPTAEAPGSPAPRSVLLLWIKEEFLLEDPVQRLSGVVSTLCPMRSAPQPAEDAHGCLFTDHSGNGSANAADNGMQVELRFRLVGPAGSSALRALAEHACRDDGPASQGRAGSGEASSAGDRSNLRGLRIFSPTASVTWNQLATPKMRRECDPGNEAALNGEQRLETLFAERLHTPFQRALLPDDSVLAALLNELCLRGVRIPCPSEAYQVKQWLRPTFGVRDHLVVVSEWDTLYGRSLTREFDRQLRPGLSERVARDLNQFARIARDPALSGTLQALGEITEALDPRRLTADVRRFSGRVERLATELAAVRARAAALNSADIERRSAMLAKEADGLLRIYQGLDAQARVPAAGAALAENLLSVQLQDLGSELSRASFSSGFPGVPAEALNRSLRDLGKQVQTLALHLQPQRWLHLADVKALAVQWKEIAGRLENTGTAGTRAERERRQRLAKSLRRLAADSGSTQVHRFTYLRGLDGSTAGQTKPGDVLKAEKQDRDTSEKRKDRAEAAVGDDQLDYLQRMADDIEELDDRLWRESKERIRAIGILGSDFYDKLLVLRALRQRFPATLFFTTDLDARFFDPARAAWTRNLLVGATFGLALAPEFQGSTPRFRNSHQTSYYLAGLAALDRAKIWRDDSHQCVDASGEFPIIGEAIKPEIFEVGRGNAFQLSPMTSPSESATGVSMDPRKGSSLCLGWRQAEQDQTAQPAARPSKRGEDFSFVVWVVSGFALLLVWLVSPSSLRAALRQRGSIALLAAILAAGLFVYIGTFLPIAGQNLEPFSWSGGISIWPTEIFRALIGLLIIALFFNSLGLIERSEQRIGELLRDGRASPAIESATIDMLDGVLHDYTRASSLRRRAWRVLVSIGVFWMLSYWLVYKLGYEVQPVRGQTPVRMDEWLELMVGGVLFLALLFFVLDTLGIDMRAMRGVSSSNPSMAPAGTRPQRGEAALDIHDDEWLKVRFVAELTAPISTMLTYPFVVFFLLLVSKTTYFDNWHNPVAYKILIGVLLLFIFGAAMWVRRSAEEVRKASLERLERHYETVEQVRLDLRSKTADQETRRKLELDYSKNVADRLKALKEGAFNPWHQQPAVKILLWVLASISALGLESVLV